jgi:hypothetical protein
MIWTNSEQQSKEYNFEKQEQFVFTKKITRDEIEAIKIVRTPILIFENMGQSEILLEEDDLNNFLDELD